jgi:hypothetical protein
MMEISIEHKVIFLLTKASLIENSPIRIFLLTTKLNQLIMNFGLQHIVSNFI